MADTVTRTNLISESWQNIHDMIKSNVTDPTISSAEFRKWIYTSKPNPKSPDFAGYPIIVIESPDYEQDKEGSSCDGKSQDVTWSFEVTVIASDRGNNNQDGKGASHCDSISDSLISVFNSVTHQRTLRTNGMGEVVPTSSKPAVATEHQTKTYTRVFILDFSTRKRTSA